jgi:predicted transcriptional regulator
MYFLFDIHIKLALIVETPSNNKKEKYYTLTEKGIELAGVHTQGSAD